MAFTSKDLAAHIKGTDGPLTLSDISSFFGVEFCDVLRMIELSPATFMLDLRGYDSRVGPIVKLTDSEEAKAAAIVEELRRKVEAAGITEDEDEDDDCEEAGDQLSDDDGEEDGDGDAFREVVSTVMFRLHCHSIMDNMGKLAEFITALDEAKQPEALAKLRASRDSLAEFVAMFKGGL